MKPLHSTRAARYFLRIQSQRTCYSTAQYASPSSIRETLLSRPHNLIYDYLTPTPSNLLEASLHDLISKLPSDSSKQSLSLSASSPPKSQGGRPSILASGTSSFGTAPHLPSIASRRLMPHGHHIIYFPPAIYTDSLLQDGTDLLHAPPVELGLVRRLWVGGKLQFRTRDGSERTEHGRDDEELLRLDGRRAVCLENIGDVLFPGKRDGDDTGYELDKVIVEIERRVGYIDDTSESVVSIEDAEAENFRVIQRLQGQEPSSLLGPGAVVYERRDLAFMRARSREEAEKAVEEPIRAVRPISFRPTFTVPFTPTAALLFRFSALTFNAHAIHLDPSYTRLVEGYPKRLVHGPLTLIIMLQVLTAHLPRGSVVKEMQYRNLAPCFEGEEMQICGREKANSGDSLKEKVWDVWILAGSGGLAVRSSVVVVSDGT